MKLTVHKVYSKHTFLQHLRKVDANFLLPEISDLIKQSYHQMEVKQYWKGLTSNVN